MDEEAATLAAARHPGVVELVGSDDGVLRTTMIEGAHTLAEVGPLTPDEVAGVLASVASTLADLHERGVVHGGIEPSHVLLGPAGRPVLCSLGRGGEPEADVAAVGLLARRLLDAGRPDPAPGPGAPTPWHRLRRRRLGPMLAPSAATVLGRLAARAAAADPLARPTARELAAAIREGVPTARWPAPSAGPTFSLSPGRPSSPRPRPWGPGRRPEPRRPVAAAVASSPAGVVEGQAVVPAAGRRRSRLAAILTAVVAGNVALVAAIVVVTNVLADSRGGGATVPPSRLSAGRSRLVGGPATPGALDDGVSTTSIPVAVRVWPPEPLDFRDGVLTVDGIRYAIGRQGDAVVAGDWACSGRRTPALLRPQTGEIFAFDLWPAGDEDAIGRLVGTVTGGTGLRPLDADGDGCDDLEVARAGASPVLLEASP